MDVAKSGHGSLLTKLFVPLSKGQLPVLAPCQERTTYCRQAVDQSRSGQISGLCAGCVPNPRKRALNSETIVPETVGPQRFMMPMWQNPSAGSTSAKRETLEKPLA